MSRIVSKSFCGDCDKVSEENFSDIPLDALRDASGKGLLEYIRNLFQLSNTFCRLARGTLLPHPVLLEEQSFGSSLVNFNELPRRFHQRDIVKKYAKEFRILKKRAEDGQQKKYTMVFICVEGDVSKVYNKAYGLNIDWTNDRCEIEKEKEE